MFPFWREALLGVMWLKLHNYQDASLFKALSSVTGLYVRLFRELLPTGANGEGGWLAFKDRLWVCICKRGNHISFEGTIRLKVTRTLLDDREGGQTVAANSSVCFSETRLLLSWTFGAVQLKEDQLNQRGDVLVSHSVPITAVISLEKKIFHGKSRISCSVFMWWQF